MCLYREHLPLLPGAVEAVRGLAARWPLGLASSAPAVLIDTVLPSLDALTPAAIAALT